MFKTLVEHIKKSRGSNNARLIFVIIFLISFILMGNLALPTQNKELILQQDGDYDLTTLLLKPLAFHLSNRPRMKVEFRIRQFKRFIFQDIIYELDGYLFRT